MVKLSVVIITWNQCQKLERCLNSILKDTTSNNKRDYELIIVDNASSDGTLLMLDRFSSDTKLIKNHKNRGVAPARNQGIGAANGEYIMMLDDDAEIKRGCFKNIIKFMDSHEDCWCAGTKQLKPDGKLEYNARTFYDLKIILARRIMFGRFMKKTIRGHLMMDWDHNSDRVVDWVAGASFIMKREAIKKIGVLDEKYFFGFEDVDWCYRVRLAGKKVFYIHNAVVIHHIQGSSRKLASRKALNHLLSAIRFYLKFKLKK